MTSEDRVSHAAAQGWPLEQQRGRADAFHQRDLPEPAGRALWWFEVDRPTVVLGSTQRAEVIDVDRASAHGVSVARRRSGGGAVWLAPGDVTWIDVILPAGDPLWDDDVGRATHWLGDVWADVLADLGLPGAEVHRGGLVRSPWSDVVCFAGLGPGEITVGGAKVVGISQRRSRAGARFQCAVLHRWDPATLLDCCALTATERTTAAAELADCATGIGPIPGADVVAALTSNL